jgi:hypothetical protein
MLAGNTFYDPANFISIATTTVGAGGASSITFSSIPSTYSHLQIRFLARTDRAVNDGDYLLMRFNGISSAASYYAQHYIRGNGTAVLAAADGTATASYIERVPALNTTASVFGAGIIDILDYTNTSKNKVWRSLAGYDGNGDANANIRLASGMLLSTPAISSITLTSGTSSNFVQYSHFALYGVKG